MAYVFFFGVHARLVLNDGDAKRMGVRREDAVHERRLAAPEEPGEDGHGRLDVALACERSSFVADAPLRGEGTSRVQESRPAGSLAAADKQYVGVEINGTVSGCNRTGDSAGAVRGQLLHAAREGQPHPSVALDPPCDRVRHQQRQQHRNPQCCVLVNSPPCHTTLSATGRPQHVHRPSVRCSIRGSVSRASRQRALRTISRA